MKKVLSMVLILALVLALFAGCGNSQEPAASGGAPQSEAPAPDANKDAPAPDASADPFADAPKVSLRYATLSAPSGDFTGEVAQRFADAVNEKTNGTVSIEMFWSASLVSPVASFAETVSGITDIVTCAPGNEAEHFVLENSAGYFLYGIEDAWDLQCATKELYEATPAWQEEWAPVQLLSWGGSGSELVLMCTKPVNSLEDLKGLSIRCTESCIYSLFEELGAEPIRMPMKEVYESLSKGVIDGVVVAGNMLKSMNYAEVVDYIVPLGIPAPQYVWEFMNMDAWNKLSAAQQQVMLDESYDREVYTYEQSQVADAEAVEFALGMGVEQITLSDEDFAAIKDAQVICAEKKAAELDAAGYDGAGLYAAAREIAAKYGAQ